MKIKTFGARHFTCQVNRIDEGLKSLGHEVLESEGNPELIYSNNRWHEEALKRKEKYPNAKLILNVLDIPEHAIKSFELERLRDQLLKADKVTCISFFVKNQLKRYLNINAHVIYNPMKDLTRENYVKDIPFLFVGRANDGNKRFAIIRDTLRYMKIAENNLLVIGSNDPGFGMYAGEITDEELNIAYNRSNFVFLPSKIEGIGLPMVEGIICDCAPLLCKDNLTACEILPEFTIECSVKKIAEKIDVYCKDFPQHLINKYKPQMIEKFSKENVAKNIIKAYNTI